jgi:very-short-patch-repair endonuclease
VLDFYCARARLCVEVDGYSHGTDDRPARDARRDLYLERAGVYVERLNAAEVLADPHAVAHGVRRLAEDRVAAGAARPLSQLR